MRGEWSVRVRKECSVRVGREWLGKKLSVKVGGGGERVDCD